MRPVLATLVILAVLAGCARGGRPPADRRQAFEDRARAVAEAWRAAATGEAWRTGFVPLQHLTVPPARGFTEETKVAYAAGWYETRAALPGDTPPAGRISFPDGSTLPAPLTSARDAYAELDKGDPPCRQGGEPAAAPPPGTGPPGGAGTPAPHTCAVLTVTAATLGTATLRTSRGEANVPAWLFTVAELPAPVARVAVAPSAVSPVPSPSVAPMEPEAARGLAAVHEFTAAEGDRLTYTIGIGACDRNPAAVVHETDDLVVLAGTVDPPTGGSPCVDLLKLVSVSVRLGKPLGSRPALDAVGGRPLVLLAR